MPLSLCVDMQLSGEKKIRKKDEPPGPRLQKAKGTCEFREAMRRHALYRRFLRSLSALKVDRFRGSWRPLGDLLIDRYR